MVDQRFLGRSLKPSYLAAYESCSFLILFMTTVNFYDKSLCESLYSFSHLICNSSISYKGYNPLTDSFDDDKEI